MWRYPKRQKIPKTENVTFLMFSKNSMKIAVALCALELANLRGGTRKVGKQERNRRKNEGERGGKNT